MSDDWGSVAREVNSRAAQLGLNQKELAARSGVSLATVREIQQAKIRRRRNPRTLEALSIALQRQPRYLMAVLDGKPPPEPPNASGTQQDAVLMALNAIVRELRGLRAQVGTLSKRIDAVTTGEAGKDERMP